MGEQDDWWCNPREAAKYILVDQLGTTDACGFSPFSVDVKPKHGSPDFATDVAFEKIGNRVKGLGLASEVPYVGSS